MIFFMGATLFLIFLHAISLTTQGSGEASPGEVDHSPDGWFGVALVTSC
jgi:hypothetical protein